MVPKILFLSLYIGYINFLKANPNEGILIETNITEAPCKNEQLSREMNITIICLLKESVTKDKTAFLKLMKFTKQNPTMYEDEKEYNSIFHEANATLTKHNFFYSKNVVRQDGFVALCKHESDVDIMTFEKCNLFKRSYTNKGIGFSYNNAKADVLYKQFMGLEDLHEIFSINKNTDPVKMKSASLKFALKVFIQNNEEEVQNYEKTVQNKGSLIKDPGDLKLKPRKVQVVLHDPNEPANFRSNSFEIFLGHTTTVYITPREEFTRKSVNFFKYDNLQNPCLILQLFNF